MDPAASYDVPSDAGHGAGGTPQLKPGTGGSYPTAALKPGDMLNNLLAEVPELREYGNLDLKVVFNKDSSRVVRPATPAAARAGREAWGKDAPSPRPPFLLLPAPLPPAAAAARCSRPATSARSLGIHLPRRR